MATVIDELASIPDRIKASAERLSDLTAQTSQERAIRDELIVEAHDHAGLKMADIARAAGISQPHVVRILASHGDD